MKAVISPVLSCHMIGWFGRWWLSVLVIFWRLYFLWTFFSVNFVSGWLSVNNICPISVFC